MSACGEGREQIGVRAEGIHGDPGIGGRAAPGGIDEADGDVFLCGNFAAVEVRDGGELCSGFRSAEGPGIGDVVEWEIGAFAIDDEETEFGIRRRGDFLVGILDDGAAREALEGHFHVGLAGGEPDVADEKVGKGDVGAIAGEGEGVGSARGFRREPEAEGAAGVDDRGDGLRVEFGGEVRAGRGPSPDVDGAIALEDGVIAEHVREANLCAEG